jgi:5-dehydro-2-deoxygluconokinase
MDHQSSFANVLDASWPPSAEDALVISREKAELVDVVIDVLSATSLPTTSCAVLVDSQCGRAAAVAAHQAGIGVIAAVERSTASHFDFLYGPDFATRLAHLQATGAKVKLLNGVAWDNPQGLLGLARLLSLRTWCTAHTVELLVEIVEPPESSPKAATTLTTAQMLYDAGVAPDVWKVEPLTRAETIIEISTAARAGGFTPARYVVLGGSLSFDELVPNVERLASSGAIDGFAVGRALWAGPLMERLTGTQTRAGTTKELKDRFRSLLNVFA